jgi:hypothetical protein
VPFFKLAILMAQHEPADAAAYWRLCHQTRRRMKQAGMHVDPPLAALCVRLERRERRGR